MDLLTEQKLMEARNQLDKLVNDYQDGKLREKDLKQCNETLNKQIKKLFLDNDFTEHETDRYVAKMSITQKTDFNEEKAIQILKEKVDADVYNKIVKTKEYIDEDALENCIYNNLFDQSILAECITELDPIYTLKVKEIKK